MNYDFKLEFLSSKQIAHVNGLSKLIPTQKELLEDSVIAALQIDREIKTMINNTIRELPVTLLEIKTEVVNDEFIKTTKQKLSRGDVTSDIYSVCDDVLLFSERVTSPKTLQKILKDFHMGHPGTNRMKSLMRSYVYSPSMDQDITNMVKTCKGCALVAKAPPITHKPWPKSEQLWSRIHIDHAGTLEDFYYLIVVDSYSKWPEVLRCRKPTTATTINFLHELFARFGVVDCLVSDNATQFTSSEFKEFCKTYQIKHITTPQYHS